MRPETMDLQSILRTKNLSVIVPVYNEGNSIIENLDLLIREIEPYFSEFEVLVISDGCTDSTNERLEGFAHPRVKKIILKKNKGKGHAIRLGFQQVKGDFVLFIDGGMELHPKEIRTFLGLQVLYNADIVLGSKRHPQSQVRYPKSRRLLSLVYQFLVNLFFDIDVTDTQVGLKLFKKEVIDSVIGDLSIDRYGFDLELLALAKLNGYSNMLEAPIRLDYFGRGRRPKLLEYAHILKVGFQVLKDSIQVYQRLNRLKKMKSKFRKDLPPEQNPAVRGQSV